MHFILIIFSIDKESLNVMSDICSWGTNCMFLNSLFFCSLLIRLLMTVVLSLLLMNFSLRHLYYMKKKLR